MLRSDSFIGQARAVVADKREAIFEWTDLRG